MKFRIYMKDPDGPFDSIREAAFAAANDIEGLDEDEKESVAESKQLKLTDFAKTWLEYDEYVTLEFDTEAGTCVVVPCS